MKTAVARIESATAALILLGAAAACGLWLWAPAGMAGWPLLPALLPWGYFWLRRRQVILPRSPVDLPLLLFLSTAGIGVWAAYDTSLALDKFWILLGGVLLYYALAVQPPAHWWAIIGLLAALGVGVGIFFLLTHDWTVAPAGIGFSDWLGRRWMDLRGWSGGLYLLPNQAAGLMALTVPFGLAGGWRLLRSGRRWTWLLVVTAGGLLLLALLTTGSRGALLGLLGGAAGWLLTGSVRAAGPRRRRAAWIAGGLGLLVLLLPLLLWLLPGDGPNIIADRLRIGRETLYLVADFPFTGGGLGAFPALYSQYILVIPFYFFPFSHNLYLDVAVEQGVLGGLAFGLVWLITLIRLWRGGVRLAGDDRRGWLLPVLFGALLVSMLDGLVTDTLYGVRGTPLLFVVPGLTTALLMRESRRAAPAAGVTLRRSAAWAMAAIFALLVVLLGTFHNPLLARWNANLGAVAMARIELEGWPTGRWDEGDRAAALDGPVGYFEAALHRDLDQPTAHHRLGLIAMARRNFDAAIVDLEAAAAAAPGHPGIVKTLGYSHLWHGDLAAAEPLLAELPGIHGELLVYEWWWQAQSRPDLAGRAAAAAQLLEDGP